MSVLLLPGAQATPEIWQAVLPLLHEGLQCTQVTYDHDVLAAAQAVADVTEAVWQAHGQQAFDCIIGHSMGGLIALQLAAEKGMPVAHIILLDTSLRPAAPFYRNLMMPANMEKHGNAVRGMLGGEAPFYRAALKASMQEGFDFTPPVHGTGAQVHACYGDRGQPNYTDRVHDLCLDERTLARLDIRFIPDACHMPMVENPRGTAACINDILMKAGQQGG